jgi:hypothetical protein
MRHLLVSVSGLSSRRSPPQTYRWSTRTGSTVISDSRRRRAAPATSPRRAAKAATSDNLPLRTAPLKTSGHLYTSADCGGMQACARLLNGRGVPFTEKMVQQQENR